MVMSSLVQIYVIFIMTAVVLANEQAILGGSTTIEGHTTGIIRRFMVTDEQRRDQILHLAVVRSYNWLNCLVLTFSCRKPT